MRQSHIVRSSVWRTARLLTAFVLLATAGQIAAASAASLAQMAMQFEEPLVPTGITTQDEDAALAQAVATYRDPADAGDFQPLEGFLAHHPHSAWRVALLTNLGLSYYHQGYFAKAVDAFEAAWAEGRDATELHAKALADRAGGELLKMHARLGHADRLATLLAEMSDRGLTGPATELRDGAKEGLWMMRHKPGVAYLCGPMALKNLLLARGVPAAQVAFLDDYRSGPHGVTLAEVGRLATQAGLPYALVHRDVADPVPVPSIIHWKVNHFAAIVGQRDGRYHIEDPTFGRTMWITRAAIDAEGSGYFLVPEARAGPAWRPVDGDEAGRVFGMGYTDSNDPDDLTPDDPDAQDNGGDPNCGMCGYAFKEMLVSLSLSDTPVGYAPPKGPPVRVTISYNQREAGQPANFSFFNVSPKWTLNWLSYIQDDPTVAGNNVTRIVAGGGEVAYTGYSTTTQSFAPEVDDYSVLTLTSASPGAYTRTLANGTVETYALSNGATTYPRLIFLTKITDPSGNAVSLTYDGQFRLTALVDATKRSTKFAYTNTSFPLQVTKITDPFARSAVLTYDSSGRLSKITDALGLTSQFTYDSSSLVDALTTPYGTTQFQYGDNGNSRFLQATDPLGHTERLEYVQGALNVPFSDPANTVPQGIVAPFNEYLNERDTFYWDKHAYAVAAGNYTQARNRHWAHLASNTNVTSNTLESVKYPLEGRIWYNYPGQPNSGLGAGQSGTLNQPTAIGRVLDDGSTQLTQNAYNALGNPIMSVDPVGRETLLTYAANQVDVVSVQQNTSSGLATVAGYTYNAAHLPLTATDAAGKTTRFTYSAAGQLTKLVNALGQATTYSYNAQGYLTKIVDALGKTTVSLTYDSAGRVATRTDSEGYVLAYTYDNLDRLTQETFPDGTTRTLTYNKLDLVSVKDRQGRVSTFTYDAARNIVAVSDPLGETTHLAHYENGALASVTDPNGSVTAWAIDLQSRVNGKQYADGTVVGYGYEATTSRRLFVSDALNQIKQFSYTLDDQVAGITYYNTVNPTPNVAFTYDTSFPRLTSMTDGSGTTQYAYGPVGKTGALRLATEQPPYANTTIALTYDALGRQLTRSVGGDVDSLAYDPIGRVASHVDDLGTFTRTYLGETGQVTGQGNGTVGTSWTYGSNTLDRKLIGVANTPSASGYQLTSTAVGDITSIVDAFDHQTWSNSYDAADRLLGASSSIGPVYGYAYDAAGNIGTIQRPSGTTTVTSNALNQVTLAGTKAYTYDANGNLLRDYARTYRWDAENRLIGISYIGNSALQTTFRYDGLGRRIAIGSVNAGVSSETRYTWCSQAVCQARTGADVVLRHYFAEGEATPSENMQLYYALDQLGSVRDAVSASTGTSVGHYDYEPYGAPIGTQGATATDFRFAGLFDHQQSGLYLASDRVYDPVVGRWLSRDPMHEIGGTNLYAYVQGNPLVLTDPLGLCPPNLLDLLASNPGLLAAIIATEIIGGGPEDPIADAIVAAEIEAAEAAAGAEAVGAAAAAEAEAAAAATAEAGSAEAGAAAAEEAAATEGTEAASGSGGGPNYVVSPDGTAYPVPEGAQGPTPVINPAGNQTGVAFTDGAGGANGQVSTMRLMDPTPPRGSSPGYPDGYIKYENSSGQGVDPYSGRTVPNSQSHFPIN